MFFPDDHMQTLWFKMSEDFKDSHVGAVVYLTSVDCENIGSDRRYKSVTFDDRFVISESEKNSKSL